MQANTDGEGLVGKMEPAPCLKNGGCDQEGGIFRNGRERIGRNCFVDPDGRMKSPDEL